jgi:predicted nicotinamide N-methyase
LLFQSHHVLSCRTNVSRAFVARSRAFIPFARARAAAMTADDAVVCEVLVDDDERADGDSLRKLEALVDDLTVSSSASHRGGADADDAAASARRRANLILLCRRVASDARAAVFARAHGAEPVLLCALNRAIRDGDDALAELVGDAVAASARCDGGDDGGATIELLAVGGSQVGGAAATRAPGVERVRLRRAGVDVDVHESSWNDAGLAWRIWGAARVLAHAVDASSGDGVEEEGEEDADGGLVDARGRRVLELGAGCGLCGLAAAACGAREVVLTEGAPGALKALERSAAAFEAAAEEAQTETSEKTSEKKTVRVAFLDWRDDMARLDADDDGAASTTASSTNFVHKRVGGDDAWLSSLPRLADDDVFDCVLGSDLLYDASHAAPLAACIARRLSTAPRAAAHVALAVRRGELAAELCERAGERGLVAEARALDVFAGEASALETHQGGHVTREEHPEAEAWRAAGGEAFARGDGLVVRAGTDEGTMTEAVRGLEGRVALFTFRRRASPARLRTND